MSIREQIAHIRLELDEIEQQLDNAEQNGVSFASDAELDAWIVRKKDALNASIERGDEAIARLDYIEGTIEQLRRHFMERLHTQTASS